VWIFHAEQYGEDAVDTGDVMVGALVDDVCINVGVTVTVA
jgi:hypothetical protein